MEIKFQLYLVANIMLMKKQVKAKYKILSDRDVIINDIKKAKNSIFYKQKGETIEKEKR